MMNYQQKVQDAIPDPMRLVAAGQEAMLVLSVTLVVVALLRKVLI